MNYYKLNLDEYMTFDQILEQNLLLFENNDKNTPKELFDNLVNNCNLTLDNVALLSETIEVLDDIHSKYQDIQKARAERSTLRRWIVTSISSITKGRTHQEKNILASAIQEAMGKSINEITQSNE